MFASALSLREPLEGDLARLLILNLPLFSLGLQVFLKDQGLLDPGELLLFDYGVCQPLILALIGREVLLQLFHILGLL